MPLSRTVLSVLAICLLGLSTAPRAQWLSHVPTGTPLTPDGRPDLAAPAPRTADGKPDLTGVWAHELTSMDEMRRLFGPLIDEASKSELPGMEIGTVHKYGINVLADVPPGQVELTRAGAALMQQRQSERDPANVCRYFEFGFPLAGLLSEPIKIVQAPRETLVLYETGDMHRQIYTDGRTLPAEINLPAYLGYSTGRWEGDVFVVETAGFNDKTRFDMMGHPHSEALRVTERFRRRDFGHLDIEMTFDDPEVYTRSFTVTIPHTLIADQDIFEFFCENELDREHILNARPGR